MSPAGAGAGRRLRRFGRILVAAGVLAPAAALAIDAGWGVDATVLWRRFSPEEQAEQRRVRDPRDDVAEIYGAAEGPPVRVVLWRHDRLIDPPEDPTRRLLFVDRPAGETVLLAARLRFFGWVAGAACLAAALVCLGLARRAAGARSGTPPPPEPA